MLMARFPALVLETEKGKAVLRGFDIDCEDPDERGALAIPHSDIRPAIELLRRVKAGERFGERLGELMIAGPGDDRATLTGVDYDLCQEKEKWPDVPVVTLEITVAMIDLIVAALDQAEQELARENQSDE